MEGLVSKTGRGIHLEGAPYPKKGYKRCTRCSHLLRIAVENFALRPNKRHSSWCRQCTRDKANQMAQRNRRMLNIHKDNPCTDCGVTYPFYVMQLDHVTGDKKYNVGNSITRSVVSLQEEIAKTELVCANCHAVRTYTRGQHLSGRKRTFKRD